MTFVNPQLTGQGLQAHLDVRDPIPVRVLHQVPGLLPRHDPVLDDHLAAAVVIVAAAAVLLTLGQLLKVVDVDGLGLLAPARILDIVAVKEMKYEFRGLFIREKTLFSIRVAIFRVIYLLKSASTLFVMTLLPPSLFLLRCLSSLDLLLT